jgi:hypothetical protein
VHREGGGGHVGWKRRQVAEGADTCGATVVGGGGSGVRLVQREQWQELEQFGGKNYMGDSLYSA